MPVYGNGYSYAVTDGSVVRSMAHTTDNGGSHIAITYAIQPIGGTATAGGVTNKRALGFATKEQLTDIPSGTGLVAELSSNLMSAQLYLKY